MKNVFIVRNDHEDSKRCERLLREKFNSLGVGVNSGYTEDTKLIICIGGDGTFLRSVHSLGFPEQNIVGINTGGLGFFQEINTGELDNFIEAYVQGRYSVQTLQCLQASIAVDKAPDSKDARMQKYGHAQLNGEDNIVFNCESEDEKKRVFKANFLNEITVKSVLSKPVHIDIYIGNQFTGRRHLGRHVSRQYGLQLFFRRGYNGSETFKYPAYSYSTYKFHRIQGVHIQFIITGI